jgi:excisionase family DNA binding protein
MKAVEVAQRLDISKAMAFQLMQRGQIPTIRVGQAIRVRQQDLEEFIRSQVKLDLAK